MKHGQNENIKEVKLVNIKRKANTKPTNFILVKYEDSTTQTDTEAKEGDNEHSANNIGIKGIALPVLLVPLKKWYYYTQEKKCIKWKCTNQHRKVSRYWMNKMYGFKI